MPLFTHKHTLTQTEKNKSYSLKQSISINEESLKYMINYWSQWTCYMAIVTSVRGLILREAKGLLSQSTHADVGSEFT